MSKKEEKRALLSDFTENKSSLDRSRFISLEIRSSLDQEDDFLHSKDDPTMTRASNTLLYLPSPINTSSKVMNLKSPSMEKVMYEMDPNPKYELLKLFELAHPMIITYVLEFLPGCLNIMIVGHIDSPWTKLYVDAATLSVMFTNITSFSVGIGLLYGLDTLCSQAYGAKRLMKMGIYMQSSMLVFGVLLIPMVLINWHAEYFLKWTGQDPQVSALAGQYSRVTIIGTLPLFLYEMHRKILQAQDITRPLVFCAIIGNVVNVVGGYFLTYYTSMGFMASAYTRAIGNFIMCSLLIPYYLYHPNYQLWWPGWNFKEAKAHVGLFLRLGVPGMIMLMMEWCAFELMALMAGILPDGVMAVTIHAVLSNVSAFLYMFFMGLGVAANIRIGQALGANQPRKALLISKISMLIVLFMGLVLAFFLFLFRFEIPKLMINDRESIQRTSLTLLVLVPYTICDGLNCTVQSIFRGIGRQGMAAKINAIAFYLIGIPIGAFLAFHFHYEVKGLWLGFGSGVAAALLIGMGFLYRYDWNQLAKEAQTRTAK